MKTGRVIKVGWVGLGLIVLGLATASPTAASDSQVRFEMVSPFRVGSHGFDAGVIAVRTVSAYTPSTSILEVWVNGECLGMIPAQRGVSEGTPQRAEAFFRRDDDGRLEMIGFQLAGRVNGTTYRFP